MAEEQLTMFGKTYDTVGSADNNLLLQTRGDIKIRWGGKYIDLIKNGKINVDVDLVKKVKDKDSIFKDGIYLVENGETPEVWLYIGGTLVNLVGEIGTTYVSFIGTQDVDAEKRYQALTNAGFYYDTIEDAQKANIKSGLIYIVDQNQLYYIKNGELSPYVQSLTVSDPLTIGLITIDGKTATISGPLNLSMGDAKYISFTNNGIDINVPITTYNSITSDNFEHNQLGYSIYYDEVRGWSCMELDYLYVRNVIEYQDIVDITYEELYKLYKSGKLAKGRQYKIIDFQNEWEIGYPYLKNVERDVKNGDGTTSKQMVDEYYYYYWPIVLTAKDSRTFEKEGYFHDNPKWIIEYDIDFRYYVNSGFNTKDRYWTQYTKGRITKLTDEYNNEGNYDFKHRTFNPQGYEAPETQDGEEVESTSEMARIAEELKHKVFTFDALNTDEVNSNAREEVKYSFKNVHDHQDASQLPDSGIKNNKIYIKESSYETIEITGEDGNPTNVDALRVYDEGIIFLGSNTTHPTNNSIGDVTGKYFVSRPFYNNTIEGILWDEDYEETTINYYFYYNTTGKIYMKDTLFAEDMIFHHNVTGDIQESQFEKDSHDNVFQNINKCTFNAPMIKNTFDQNLENVSFKCDEMTGNHITGTIDTGSDSYPIEATKFNNNVINDITKSAITCYGKNIIDNIIHNIIQYGINNSTIMNVIALDILGIDGKTDPNHNNGGGGSGTELEFDIENPTLTKEILLTGQELGEKLYSVGILSDLHLRKNHDTDSSTGELKDWFDEDDLKNILKIFKADEDIKFICSCGDIMDSAATHHVGDDESPEADAEQFYDVMKNYKNDLRFFSCLGNHDSAGLYNSRTGDTINSGQTNDSSADGYNSGAKARIDSLWFNKILFNLDETTRSTEEVHYFSFPNNLTNSYSKLNYWFEKDNDIYIFMSVDYGNELYLAETGWHEQMIRGRKILSASDIALLDPYIDHTMTSIETEYNYQYYHPQVLLWLRNILEDSNNSNKKIFVFSHHFMPHRVGNDLSSSSTYALIDPSGVSEAASHGGENTIGNGITVHEGSNALSGIEFWFINKLVNDHSNVIWFSGHSHISWDNGGEAYHITNHDYPVKLTNYTNKTIYTKDGAALPDNTGWWVALPSMSKPVKSTGSVYDDADFTIMDVHENGVKIRGYNTTRVVHSGSASDLDTKLHAMYLAIPECTQNEATWGTSASDLQKLGSTDTSKGYIKIHITNESGYDVVWNGRAAIFYGDGTEHDKHQIYCGWRVDNYQDDTQWHSWHYYYTDPTNYIFENGDSVDIIVPIKTADYDLTGKYIWNKVRGRKPSADSPDSARDTSLGLDDNDYFRLYYTKSKTSDDLPHSASLDIVDERIISDADRAITSGKTFNVKITADRMAGWVTAGVYAEDGFDPEADKACIVYQSTPESGDPYDVYVPIRLSDWETIDTGESEQEGGDRVLTEHPDLGPVYLDIYITNTTNHDIYVTEMFKFFPTRGEEWGYIYIIGPSYKNYANIKIASQETRKFDHSRLVYEEGSAIKNNGGRTDLHKPASYMNDVVLRNDGIPDEIGVYTYIDVGAVEPQLTKLYPRVQSNGDPDMTPLTWQAGTADSIVEYRINVTDGNYTYWTTPRS